MSLVNRKRFAGEGSFVFYIQKYFSVSSVSSNILLYLLHEKCPTITFFFRGLVVSRSLGVGGRLLSSLLSAYLDIWPDTHCKEGTNYDDKKTLEKDNSKKNETGIDEKESGGKNFLGKKHEEQPKTEKNGEMESCKMEAGVGKIQCGR